MAVKIKCPHCKKVFSKWNDYAHHILKSHKDDERCAWATHALAEVGDATGFSEETEEPTLRGRPLDYISPARQKKLPEYLRKQLE